jgi:hypothetical protein
MTIATLSLLLTACHPLWVHLKGDSGDRDSTPPVDSEADTDTDTDSDTDSDADTDADTDTDPPCDWAWDADNGMDLACASFLGEAAGDWAGGSLIVPER